MDESIEDMNARLLSEPDHSLGFGFLEGQPKQQLVQVSRAPFVAYSSDDWTVEKVDDTSSEEGQYNLHVLLKSNPGVPLKKVAADVDADTESSKAKSFLVFAFRRVVAKRSIAIPSFQDLEPVGSNQHVSGSRWLVELYGNCVCVEEYYGGEALVVLEWNREYGLTAAEVEAKLRHFTASGRGEADITKEFEKIHMRAGASVKGFSIPRDAAIDRSTLAGVMELVKLLPRLPIASVAPVGTKTVGLHSVRGFLRGITVETKIRDVDVLQKLTEKLQAFADTSFKDTRPYLLVHAVRAAIEDASEKDRSVLPALTELADSIVCTLRDHGRRFDLYERENVRRIHTADCDEETWASRLLERLSFLPVESDPLIAPLGRYGQAFEFDRAVDFKQPRHYRCLEYSRSTYVLSYYDRVKVRLLFDDDVLVREWRSRLDAIVGTLPTNSP